MFISRNPLGLQFISVRNPPESLPFRSFPFQDRGSVGIGLEPLSAPFDPGRRWARSPVHVLKVSCIFFFTHDGVPAVRVDPGGCFLLFQQGKPVHQRSPGTRRCCSSPFLTARSGRSLAWSADRRPVFHVPRIPATGGIHTKTFPNRFPDRSFRGQACSRFGRKTLFPNNVRIPSRKLLPPPLRFRTTYICPSCPSTCALHSFRLSYTPGVIPFHTT